MSNILFIYKIFNLHVILKVYYDILKFQLWNVTIWYFNKILKFIICFLVIIVQNQNVHHT